MGKKSKKRQKSKRHQQQQQQQQQPKREQQQPVVRPPRSPPGFSYYRVYDEHTADAKPGLIYSSNGNPDKPYNVFIAQNVPFSHSKKVGKLMNFLHDRGNDGDHAIAHGQSASCENICVLLKLTEGDYKEKLLEKTFRGTTDSRHPLYELVPMFGDSLAGREPAPEGNEDIVNDIIHVWYEQQEGFILYIDGNSGNCGIANVKYIDLAVALRHIDDGWVVDWDVNLTLEQTSFVRRHSRYFYRFAKVMFRKNERCEYCGLMDSENKKLQLCSRCKCTWYCCQEHQKAHWPDHKAECKKLQQCRTNRPTDEAVPLIRDENGLRYNAENPQYAQAMDALFGDSWHGVPLYAEVNNQGGEKETTET